MMHSRSAKCPQISVPTYTGNRPAVSDRRRWLLGVQDIDMLSDLEATRILVPRMPTVTSHFQAFRFLPLTPLPSSFNPPPPPPRHLQVLPTLQTIQPPHLIRQVYRFFPCPSTFQRSPASAGQPGRPEGEDQLGPTTSHLGPCCRTTFRRTRRTNQMCSTNSLRLRCRAFGDDTIGSRGFIAAVTRTAGPRSFGGAACEWTSGWAGVTRS